MLTYALEETQMNTLPCPKCGQPMIHERGNWRIQQEEYWTYQSCDRCDIQCTVRIKAAIASQSKDKLKE